MAIDIALSQSAFALGAGYFAAYALFGIPANLLMNRWGANAGSAPPLRCGALSACTGLVTNEQQFIVLRFLLGIAEAGFYPSILLLASIYFPNKVRASVIGIFVLGVPAALTLGSPLSGHCWRCTACWVSPAGSGCSCWKGCRPSPSASSPFLSRR